MVNFDLVTSGARLELDEGGEGDTSNKVLAEPFLEFPGDGSNLTSGQVSMEATASAAEPRSKAVVVVVARGMFAGRLEMLTRESRLESPLEP